MHRTISNEHGKSITTELVHESGESFVTAIPLVLGKNDMQGLGSAITYARRYGIMSLLNLPAEDDDGEQNRKGTAQKLAPVDAPTPETKRTTNTNW